MSKQPITFRFTDHEYEVLEKHQQPNESINLCAARLLRDKLGIIDNDGVTKLEEQTLNEWVTNKVNSSAENLKSYLEDYVNRLVDKKVDELKLKPRTSTRTRKTLETKVEN